MLLIWILVLILILILVQLHVLLLARIFVLLMLNSTGTVTVIRSANRSVYSNVVFDIWSANANLSSGVDATSSCCGWNVSCSELGELLLSNCWMYTFHSMFNAFALGMYCLQTAHEICTFNSYSSCNLHVVCIVLSCIVLNWLCQLRVLYNTLSLNLNNSVQVLRIVFHPTYGT